LPDDVALRVLLADDDPAVRSAIRQALEEEGVEVEECDSGAAALEVADRDAPDLLVLDLEMPGVDAFEALTRLRARPATRELPVVVLVPNDDEDTEIRAFSLGADDVLTKPIRARALAARLLAHLRRLGAADGYGGLPPSDLLRRRDGAAA